MGKQSRMFYWPIPNGRRHSAPAGFRIGKKPNQAQKDKPGVSPRKQAEEKVKAEAKLVRQITYDTKAIDLLAGKADSMISASKVGGPFSNIYGRRMVQEVVETDCEAILTTSKFFTMTLPYRPKRTITTTSSAELSNETIDCEASKEVQ